MIRNALVAISLSHGDEPPQYGNIESVFHLRPIVFLYSCLEVLEMFESVPFVEYVYRFNESIGYFMHGVVVDRLPIVPESLATF